MNLWVPAPQLIDDVVIVDSRTPQGERRQLLSAIDSANFHGATIDAQEDPIASRAALLKLGNVSAWNEVGFIVRSSAPLIVTFFLQYSLEMAALFSVGHLGKVELGAVSLASMTANVTGFAMIQGIATCLDTLCSQAYGAGKPKLVGLYVQKCVVLTLVFMIPIFLLWYRADALLPYVVSSKEVKLLNLTTNYLRITLIGVPGYILFECGKRFLQAQGIYHASTLVLIISAPINIALNYLLVWDEKIGLGFYGAPIAVAITDWLLACLLVAYVLFIDGKKCWNGFSIDVFKDWSPLIHLAIPGVIMVEAEFFAYEVMTLGSSYFGTTVLAAQTILASVVSLAYEVPFAVSVAIATRVANFIGASAIDAAKLCTRVSILVGLGITLNNAVLLYFTRYSVAGLFSNEQEVIELTAQVMPLAALMNVFDGMCCQLAGILRGQGRQYIGGYLNTIGYYALSLPLGVVLAFKLDLELQGMWLAIIAGLLAINTASLYFIHETDWPRLVYLAHKRDDHAAEDASEY